MHGRNCSEIPRPVRTDFMVHYQLSKTLGTYWLIYHVSPLVLAEDPISGKPLTGDRSVFKVILVCLIFPSITLIPTPIFHVARIIQTRAAILDGVGSWHKTASLSLFCIQDLVH